MTKYCLSSGVFMTNKTHSDTKRCDITKPESCQIADHPNHQNVFLLSERLA